MKVPVLLLSGGLLAGCATGAVDTTKWPSPDTVQAGVDGVYLLYGTDCALQPTAKWCAKAIQDKVLACHSTAQAGVDTYREAYDTGKVTDAVIANETKLLPAILSCVATAKKV
jgi:hypothetical protein